MKFSTQLTTLIIASSIQAQQQNDVDIGNLINSAISQLNNVLPTDQVQSIVSAVSKGANQNQRPTGNPTTIAATGSNTSNVPTGGPESQISPTSNSVAPTDNSNTSATPTSSSDNSSATSTDSSDSSASSNSSSTTSSASRSSTSSFTTSGGSQISAPSKYTYVVAGATFALIGNYLI